MVRDILINSSMPWKLRMVVAKNGPRSSTTDRAFGTQSEADRPFVTGAMVETMRRDFDKLRTAIREHDSAAAERAWDKCERWVDQLRPTSSNESE